MDQALAYAATRRPGILAKVKARGAMLRFCTLPRSRAGNYKYRRQRAITDQLMVAGVRTLGRCSTAAKNHGQGGRG